MPSPERGKASGRALVVGWRSADSAWLFHASRTSDLAIDRISGWNRRFGSRLARRRYTQSKGFRRGDRPRPGLFQAARSSGYLSCLERILFKLLHELGLLFLRAQRQLPGERALLEAAHAVWQLPVGMSIVYWLWMRHNARKKDFVGCDCSFFSFLFC